MNNEKKQDGIIKMIKDVSKLNNEQTLLGNRNSISELVQRNEAEFFQNRKHPSQKTEIQDFNSKNIVSRIFAQLAERRRFSYLNHLISQGIISKLCKVFKKQSTHQNQGDQIIRLFGTLISFQIEEECQSNIIPIILEQGLLFDSMLKWHGSQNWALNTNLKLIIDNLLLADSSSWLVLQGGFSAFIDSALTRIKQNKFQLNRIHRIFGFCQLLAKYLKKSCIKMQVKLYFVILLLQKYNLIFQILNEIILFDQSQSIDPCVVSILSIIFSTFFFNIKDTQQEKLCVNFAKHKNLFHFIVKQTQSQQGSIKLKSWNILALFSSIEQHQVQHIFLSNLFFQVLINSEKSIKQNNDYMKDSIKQKIVLCIGNLADFGDLMRKNMFRPQIIEILINSVLQNRSQKLKINGYYAILNLINTSDPILLNQVINKFPIPDLLVHGLVFCQQDQKMLSEISKALEQLIGKDRKIYKKQFPFLLDKLEAKYYLSTLIEKTKFKLQEKPQK